MHSATFSTRFGCCSLSWGAPGLASFSLGAEQADIGIPAGTPDWISRIIVRVEHHFSGDFQDFSDLPLDFGRITPFQKQVYLAAQKVKSGETRTYGWLAREAGNPSASRAVGAALGRNPWLLIVPCHRFLGADGRLTGFSAPGGLATKRRLLDLEARLQPAFDLV